MDSRTTTITIDRVSLQGRDDEPDLLAVEEPLEIRLAWNGSDGIQSQSVSVTMRTPGDDRVLAIGFLFSEGVVTKLDEIADVVADDEDQEGGSLTNVVQVSLADGIKPDFELLRGYPYRTATGGFCGKTSVGVVAAKSQFGNKYTDMRMTPRRLYPLPIRLAEAKGALQTTGGINAAALIDENGQILEVFEDVRKNNAVDKLIGTALTKGDLPLARNGILVSGRASFELIQKAAMAGCPFLAAVGAPSSLAVSLAREMQMTLIGFLREGRFNIYSGADRIV